jgi:NAD(P)-dependent dehydrogenase (short-subunit alcohol dehydrogenase family)
MTEDEWDVVVHIHLKGAAATTKHAMEYWTKRSQSERQDASLIQVSSSSGFVGKFGQANYGAAKMGVIALSRIASLEGTRYGVRSNVVAPLASTRLVLTIPGRKPPPENVEDPMAPRHVAPLVGWLASASCPADSQVFHVYANRVVVLEMAHVAADIRTKGEWTIEELDRVLPSHLVTPRELAYFLPARDQPADTLPPGA